MNSKVELIDEVRRLNFTASAEFLAQFDEEELREYIVHLSEVDAGDLTAVVAAPVPFH